MKKTILKISLTCLIVRVVLFCTTFGAVCAESTTTTQTLQQVMQNGNVYDLMSYVSRKYASFPDSWGGSPITGWSYQAYSDWLDEKGLSSQLQENVTITEGASGGRSYNIPQDLRETMVQYVQETYINQNPLSYKEAYIYSYNYLDTSVFPTYSMYSTTKELCKQNSPKWILLHYYYSSGTLNRIYFIALDTGFDYGLVGTLTGGSFNNVNLYKNWATLGRMDQIANATKKTIMANGSVSEGIVTPTGSFPSVVSLANTSSQPATNTKTMLISSLPSNELVYVFSTLNAYKNYNAGSPQAYYLPSGSTLQVPYNDPFTDDDLYRAGNYYNNIVDNSQSGWTAEQVLALVDRILGVGGSGGTNNAGTGNDDDSFSLGFLGKIGEVITAVTGSITPMKDLVEDGIKNFLEDVFGWLPAEIVALWIAGITFAVFFGILRVIRG